MILFLFTFLMTTSIVWAEECASVHSIPEAIQIAWISPVQDTVHSKASIEVVNLEDLRVWLQTENPEPKELLHQLGMLPQRSKRDVNPADYKITIFDVETEKLCRPIVTEAPQSEYEGMLDTPVEPVVQEVEGLPLCARSHRSNFRYARYGYTGCGYTLNTETQSKGFDLYRVSWQDASAWGFCVLPLSRYLMGVNP